MMNQIKQMDYNQAKVEINANSLSSTKSRNISCVGCFKRHLECSSHKPSCLSCLKMNLPCEYLSMRKVSKVYKHKLNYPDVGSESQTSAIITINKKRVEKEEIVDQQGIDATAKRAKINQSIPADICASNNMDVTIINNKNIESSLSAIETKSLIPLSKLLQCENKIYSIYFDFIDHISSEMHPCVVKDNFKLIHSMMINFIKTNLQLQRISNVLIERVQKSTPKPKSCNVLHSCEYYMSLDVENDSYDYFACNPSPNLEAASHKHSTRCALHLMRTNNVMNTNPYLYLDYTISNTSLNDVQKICSIQMKRIVKPSVNKAFEQVFGYNSDQILQYTSHFVHGVLPFYGDIFALLFDDTNHVKRIMHRFATKISQSFKEYYLQAAIDPNSCFTVETLFEVGTEKNPLEIRDQERNSMMLCKCQILSRNIFLVGGAYGGIQIHINFVPIESVVSVPNNVQNECEEFEEDDDDDGSWIDSVIESFIEESSTSEMSPTPSELTM